MPYVYGGNDEAAHICDVDLIGPRQISGNGGMLDFVYGAFHSRRGKSFICLPSLRENGAGQRASRIVPALDPATIVTVPRTMTNYVVTECGAVASKPGPPGSGPSC